MPNYHQSQRFSVPISETSSTSNLTTTHQSQNLITPSSQSRTQHPPGSGSSHPARATLPCLALPSSPQPNPAHPPRAKLPNSQIRPPLTTCCTMQMLRRGGTTGPCSAARQGGGGCRTTGALHRQPKKGGERGWHT